MSAGITKVHGGTFTGGGNNNNVTGSRGSFISGYQLRWFRFSGNFSGSEAPESDLEVLVRKVQTVATVMVVGEPDGSYVMLGLDGASFDGRGDYTGYGNAGMNAQSTLSDIAGVSVSEFYIVGQGFDN